MRLYQSLVVFFITTGTYAVAFGFAARVVSVPDGDTVEVYKQGEQFKTLIDLYGIDCPEKQQYFGYAAKNATASLVGGKMVWIDIICKDRSGRLRAVLRLRGKT